MYIKSHTNLPFFGKITKFLILFLQELETEAAEKTRLQSEVETLTQKLKDEQVKPSNLSQKDLNQILPISSFLVPTPSY